MLTTMIPTKGRPEKLLRCVRSIPDWVGLSIVATKASDIPVEIYDGTRVQTIVMIDPTLSVPQAFNRMVSLTKDDIIMSSDDVEYEEGAFDELVELLYKHDHDIVIGMHVTNMICNKDAFHCVGSVFKDAHKPLYCEEYKHFYIDTEVGDLAKRLGKFVYSHEAKLKNFHPASGCPADDTHTELRREKLAHDQALYERRSLGRASIPQESR